MKRDPINLLYHTLHKRPMQGCLPLFFVLAALMVAGIAMVVHVALPEPTKPRGVGRVYYKNDELTRFLVRQRGALPLRLPAYADPAVRLPIPEHALPLRRRVELMPAPEQPFIPIAPDTAVPGADAMPELPPPAADTPDGKEVLP